MRNRKQQKKISSEYIILFVGIVLSIVFLLLDTIGSLGFLRNGISYIMDPIDFNANFLGTEVRSYLESFVSLKEFRDEYNRMSIDIYEKDVENSFYVILKEENEALKKQISLGEKDQKYVMAKVLREKDSKYLRINKGEKDGIAVGDTVLLGNMYVGTVVVIDNKGSLVRTPLHKGSSLEVVVVSGNIEEVRAKESTDILSKGVVNGSSEGIIIENMSMGSNLTNGDVVVVNDARVGEYLVLGYLQNISENPAATSRSGFVDPIIEYEKLITLFVRINF
ncbi:MAG: rod shape-determining protein MreC [Candidatus Dojkabacteria bacterium]